MKRWLALFALIPCLSFASDGEDITATINTEKKIEYPYTVKLCDTRTSATDCGPFFVPQNDAYKSSIMVYRQSNSGSDCTFDNWNIYQLPDTNTAATYGKPALYTLDDDGTGGITGVTAGQRLDVYGTIGPYVWIDAGTLGTCDNFTIILQVNYKP